VKKDSLGKLYDRFSAHERFRLVIEAIARGDEREVQRLRDTCPREMYRMTELPFRDRITGSMEMTMGVCLDLVPHLAQLKLIEALRKTLPLTYNYCEDVAMLAYFDGHEAGSKHAWEAAGKAGDQPGWEEEWDEGREEDEAPVIEAGLDKITAQLEVLTTRFVENLEELERSISRDALTIWEAFANFCNEELFVEPEKLIKVWFEPLLPEIERLKSLRAEDAPQPEPEGLKEYEAALKRGWDSLIRSN
jgi:hypothetical protein